MRISDWSSDVCSADLGALGHCAECHTPRGKLGQLDADRPLQGGALGRIKAPDISPAGLAARGWTADDLNALFAAGIAPQGAVFDEMFPVVHLSTQHLAKQDIAALTTYLLGDTPDRQSTRLNTSH